MKSSSDIRSEISSILGPEKELVLTEKMHHIVSNFRNRAMSVRQKLEQAASPEIEDELEDDFDDEITMKDTIEQRDSRQPENIETPGDNKGLIEKLME